MNRIRRFLRQEDGYILALVMLALMVVLMMSVTLLGIVQASQQHVQRDRALTQSLSVAEAGLNQYLWMVAAGKSTETNDFAIAGNDGPDPHFKSFTLTNPYDGSTMGTYQMQVIPPGPEDPRVAVKVTGRSTQPVDAPRTVVAHLGRPFFSEYILLVDEEVYIGGWPDLNREWHGKTHSNTGIRIETRNIVDSVSCARNTYEYTAGSWKPGVWSQYIAADDPSRAYWHFPVPPVDFNTVTSDFVRLEQMATGEADLPYVGGQSISGNQCKGWYIKILPNQQYQVARVYQEYEARNYSSGLERGGYLRFEELSSPRSYPNKGVIFVRDDVWVEGTNIDGRLTIASSGQLNPAGQNNATNINLVGDITYSAKDGTVAVGFIAQKDVKIPMYAPYLKAGTPLSTVDMEVDAAIIAQQGAEYVSYDSSGSYTNWGPKRDMLTFYGSISSFETPFRRTSPIDEQDNYWAGFKNGANTYDTFLLHNPPPYFPTIGTYQILDWQELPATEALEPETG